jgi:hypothetical protein
MGLTAGSRMMKATAIAWVGLQLLSLCIAEQSAIYENESRHRIDNSSAYTGRISVKKGHLTLLCLAKDKKRPRLL